MRQHGGGDPLVILFLATALWAISGCAAGSDIARAPGCTPPAIEHSAAEANALNVLSAFVRAAVHGADSVRVRVTIEGITRDSTPQFGVHEDSVRVPVLGLFGATVHGLQLVASNACGSTAGELLSFTTDVLPADLPAYSVVNGHPSPGYVVFAAGNYGIVLDNTGRVVWYRHFPDGLGLNFQAQPVGGYVARPPVASGVVAAWVQVAVDGSVVRTLGCAHDLPPRMHDMIAEPDGGYWLLCDETRTIDLSAQGESSRARVLGTAVQHRSAAGELLFEWSPFDHLAIELGVLDPADRTGSVINWTHGNALDLDADGNVLVSYRNLSEVLKIDTRTGVVIWRMGGLHSDLTFTDGILSPFTHQHGARALGTTGLILLDNLGEPGGSRAERYEVDVAHHEARLSGVDGASANLVAQVGGSAQLLPDGHVLVSFGNAGGVEEYDAEGSLVWKLAGGTGYVFRAQRIHSLYAPGVGDVR